jgi:hypothetical protein
MALMCVSSPQKALAVLSVVALCAQADPPDASKLPQDDIVGVTVLLLTCSYKDRVRPPPYWVAQPHEADSAQSKRMSC